MNTTHPSMLCVAQSASADSALAWDQIGKLYRPFIRAWLQHRVSSDDAEDLTQEVLCILLAKLPEFNHNGNKGAFRCWLREIMFNLVRAFYRNRKKATAVGGSDFTDWLNSLESPDSDVSRQWDQLHDLHVLRSLITLAEQHFEPHTMQAFQMRMIDNVPAIKVGETLGMDPAAVHQAACRVRKWLRMKAAGLMEC